MTNAKLLLLVTSSMLLVGAGSGYVGWQIGMHSPAISREAATDLAISHLGEGTARNARLARSHGMPVWDSISNSRMHPA